MVVGKFFVGIIGAGVSASAVATAVGATFGYSSHMHSVVPQILESRSITASPPPTKVQTSQEQLDKDIKFDVCQRENLSFKVKNGSGEEKWILEKDYQKSRDGEILDATYNFNKCDRHVSIPKLSFS